jgi:hypothetical protein
MAPAGVRRSPTRGVFAVEDQALLLPNPIALDTSFLVEALIATQPLHSTCAGFLARIVETGVSVIHQRLAPCRVSRGRIRNRPQGTLGRPVAQPSNGRPRPAPRGASSTGCSLALREVAYVCRSHPGARRSCCRYGSDHDDRLRDCVLRRRPCHKRRHCRRRGDRHDGHRLRASTVLATRHLHRPLTACLLPQQAAPLKAVGRS